MQRFSKFSNLFTQLHLFQVSWKENRAESLYFNEVKWIPSWRASLPLPNAKVDFLGHKGVIPAMAPLPNAKMDILRRKSVIPAMAPLPNAKVDFLRRKSVIPAMVPLPNARADGLGHKGVIPAIEMGSEAIPAADETLY